MKVLKIAALAIAAVIAILAAVVIMQPAEAHVEKSIVINSPAAPIHDEIGSFQSFDAWSPWSKTNPEVKYKIVSFEGFDGTFCSEIKLEPVGSGTRVTWIYNGLNDGFKGKAMWMLMKGRMEEQYSMGLTALKHRIENRPASAPADSTKTQ